MLHDDDKAMVLVGIVIAALVGAGSMAAMITAVWCL